MVNNALVVEWLRQAAGMIREQAGYLTELDAQIGDADHGVNMARGFQKVAGQLPGWKEQSAGSTLKAVGMALIGSVGGASGPLYGSFFLDAARQAGDSAELSDEDWAGVLAAGVAGMRRIGKAQAGDKTLLDALQPGVDAFREAVSQARPLAEACGAMLAAAQRGRDATIPMVARKGRASYLGERSAGHMDPGAASACMLLEAFLEAVEARAGGKG